MDKQQITERLRSGHSEFADFVATLTKEQFEFRNADKWTAGEQLEHIIRSAAPLATALELPRFIPQLIFGASSGSSRSYEEIVSIYRDALAAGGKASGRFLPEPIPFEKRSQLFETLDRTLDSLLKAVAKFDEPQLDSIRLPHPLIGKLTVREMMYFTIYHVGHHLNAVRANLGVSGER